MMETSDMDIFCVGLSIRIKNYINFIIILTKKMFECFGNNFFCRKFLFASNTLDNGTLF